jgi:hypothetical protein
MSNTTTNGRISAVKKNDYGFYAFRIGDAWYNAGKKFDFDKGDVVEFDYYLKDEKWKTVKGDVRKLAAEAAAVAEKSAPRGNYSNTRDDYWTKKGERDVAVVEPRITYLAAVERAIALASLCISNGTLGLEKAKQADKLGIILAFVDEQTIRIANAAMSVTVGAAPAAAAPAPASVADENPENWE